MSARNFAIAAAVLTAGAVAGCADSTGPAAGRTVSLAFSTVPGAVANVGVSPALAVAGSPLVITRAQLVFSESELEPVGASCSASATTEPDEDGCPELKTGPMLVDLPLDASTRSVVSVNVPAGTYEEIEFEIDAVSSHSDDHPAEVQAFLAAHPGFEGVSIRVEGTYNGEPFVFTTGVEVEMELEFQPPITVDGTASNLVIHVDLANWFRTETGTVIDPRTANAGGENKSRVDENIEKSFDAFEEDLEG